VTEEEYGYTIQEIILERRVGVAVYICSKQNFITLDIDEQQRRLFYEIAYNYLDRGCLRSVGLNLIIFDQE
jgi:hypothetical protein